MSVLRQAFTHKSYEPGKENFELLEFEGDVALNLAVVEYLRERFPNVVHQKWTTRIKHKAISTTPLAKVAVDGGLDKYVRMGDDIRSRAEKKANKYVDHTTYMKIYEDVLEALCGAIKRILNKYTVRGVGYSACYNLISSYLDEIDDKYFFEEAYDPVSKLKDLFDKEGWGDTSIGVKIPMACSFGKSFVTMDMNLKAPSYPVPQQPGSFVKESGLERYKREMNKAGVRLQENDPILTAEHNYITFGYVCQECIRLRGLGTFDPNHIPRKRLLKVDTSNNKGDSRKSVARDVLAKLSLMGIEPLPSDVYEENI